MNKMLLIAAAGAVRTVARYILTGLVERIHNTDLPLGTFVVNVIGCFLFGLVWSVTENRLFIADENRAVALTGFMGAFALLRRWRRVGDTARHGDRTPSL